MGSGTEPRARRAMRVMRTCSLRSCVLIVTTIARLPGTATWLMRSRCWRVPQTAVWERPSRYCGCARCARVLFCCRAGFRGLGGRGLAAVACPRTRSGACREAHARSTGCRVTGRSASPRRSEGRRVAGGAARAGVASAAALEGAYAGVVVGQVTIIAALNKQISGLQEVMPSILVVTRTLRST